MKVCPRCKAEYETGTQCPVEGATLVDQAREDPLIGQVLKGMYQVEFALSQGGMSQVYVARQLTLDRQVVVKVLRAGSDDDDFVQLFFREARIASELNHPNVVNVIDFGNTEGGMVFLVLEYLRGEPLSELLEKRGGLPMENMLWVMEQTCAGVQAAHHLNIVHRDLKPNNVVVARISGDATAAKILDFGISKPLDEQDMKYTRLGMIMGTPGYLAPEQIEGKRDIDRRADIYALGAILHFLITARRPFDGDSSHVVMHKQLSEAPLPLTDFEVADVRNRRFAPIIQKAMARDREQRYGQVSELLDDLRSCAAEAAADQPEVTQALSPDQLGGAALYQYVFDGSIEADADPADVRRKLKALLDLDDDQCEKLFTGRPVVVGSNLSHAAATEYDTDFRRTGALGQIRESDDSTRFALSHRTNGSRSQLTYSTSNGGSVPIQLDPDTSTPSGPRHLSPFSTTPSPTAAAAHPTSGAAHAARRRLKRWLPAAALIVLVGSLVAVPGMRYYVQDSWAALQGVATPRGVHHDRLVLGTSAAFSGGARELGRAMQIGIAARLEEVNEAGGIHGRRLELTALDDGYEPERAIANVERFLQPDGAFALLGSVGTPTTQAVLPSLLDHQTILFGTFSGASVLRHDPPDRYVFNYRASYAEEAAAIVHYFVEEQGIAPERIAVLHQNDSYGADGLAGVEDALSRYGVKPEQVLTVSYPRNTSRVAAAVETILTAPSGAVDGVVLIATYAASARFTIELRKAGFQGSLANVSFVGSSALAETLAEAGPAYSEGVLVTQVVPLHTSYATGVMRYRAALEKYFPAESPDFISLEGYIVASLFCEALQRAGRTLTTEQVVDVLERFEGLDLGLGQTISFSPSNHQGSHRVWGTRLTADGRFEPVRLSRDERI